jgi:hypothetical protein
VAFLDPPKESAAQALQALAAHGVEVKVFTGDNELVTARVCAQVGLDADTILTGPQIERMDDARCRGLQHHACCPADAAAQGALVRELRATATWSASSATASTMRRRCARPISASAWTARWTSPRRRPTSSCWKRA